MFAKIMVVVNFILAVAFLAAAGTLLGAAEDYKGKFESYKKSAELDQAALKDQVTAADNKAKEAQDRFNASEKQRIAAESQGKVLSDSNNQLSRANDETRGDLTKLSDAQKDLQAKLDQLNKALDAARAEISTETAGRREAEAKNKAQADENARLTQDKETAEKALGAAAAAQKALEDQLDTASTTLARYRKEKGPLTGGMDMADLKGVVMAVDNKVDIYVISVGSKDGVKEGYEFTVYRGSDYVSTIVIDKVFPNYASGMTKPGTKKRDVQAGDECATRL
jgi:peptidoglycan hydrolase CwlO-like protein